MNLLGVSISSQSACLLAAGSPKPSLVNNLYQAAREAGIVDDSVTDGRQLIAGMLVAPLRDFCMLYAVRMGRPVSGLDRIQLFHDRMTAGLSKSPSVPPSEDDPTGFKYTPLLADALLAELIETEALILLQEALMGMEAGLEKYDLLGRASHYASQLNDEVRALEFAKEQVDLAILLIHAEHDEENEEIDDDEARQTLAYEDFDDLKLVSQALRAASGHLKPEHIERLLSHSLALAEQVMQLGLHRKLSFHLYQLSNQLLRRSKPPSSRPRDS